MCIRDSKKIAYTHQFKAGDQGRPITKNLARRLVGSNMWQGAKPMHSNEIASVIFDARPLTLLLSQEDCTGIRCYYARNDDSSETLVLIGVKKDGSDIGANDVSGKINSIITDSSFVEDAIIIEVGGGNKKLEFTDE